MQSKNDEMRKEFDEAKKANSGPLKVWNAKPGSPERVWSIANQLP